MGALRHDTLDRVDDELKARIARVAQSLDDAELALAIARRARRELVVDLARYAGVTEIARRLVMTQTAVRNILADRERIVRERIVRERAERRSWLIDRELSDRDDAPAPG